MSKTTKSGNIINTINEIIVQGKEKNIIHLYAEDEFLNGREITLKGKKLINFGSCSYLGLEFDERIINAGIDALRRYGSQYSSSRAYVSFPIYKELEEKLAQIFEAPILLATSSTMGHHAVIPIVVDDNDAVILDHQVHISMKDALDKVKLRGVTVEIVRHSQLDELESKIIALSNKHEKIWYFADGIYSMYGDAAPITELIGLLDKYEKLHLYIDDAHGMSWAGTHGSGFVLSKTKLHPKMILAGSLAKGFASAGGVFVFPNEKLRDKVRNWGGPLTYSGPQQPAVVAASLASANIHLSNEITEHQLSLAHKIKYCNEALQKYNLPQVSEAIGPIFYIGLGLTRVGYNMVRRMSDDGLYVNLGIFPAVPETCTGIRFTLTDNITYEDIDHLAERLSFHLPKALQEEGRDLEDIYRSFRHINRFKKNKNEFTKKISYDLKFKIQYENSIHSISEDLWNSLLGDNGTYDWKGLAFFEDVFQKNLLPEHNWKFHYYVIRDRFDKVIVATFFIETIAKDDMFSAAFISEQIENKRAQNPYYLTSKTLAMGSFLTEGSHLYLDRSSSEWKDGLMYLLDLVWKQQESSSCNCLYLRDFDADDIELRDFMMDNGFVKIQLPDSFLLENYDWHDKDGFLASLQSKKRYRIKKQVLNYEDFFEAEYISNPTDEEIEYWYQLYQNIHHKNLTLNLFPLPKKLFYKMAKNADWDILQLKLKKEYDNREERLPVAVVFSCITEKNYSPVMLGLDYNYTETYNVYRQVLFQVILRGSHLMKKKIYLGFTSGEEKKKFDAKTISNVAYVQVKDNFNISVIDQFSNLKQSIKVEMYNDQRTKMA